MTSRVRDQLIVAGFAVACLAPFIGKAYHIDDPAHIYAARHIRVDPLRPYDFDLNWLGTQEPAWRIMNRPPLVPYYMAGVMTLGGGSESEPLMHAAFLIFPAMTALAMYRLSRRVTRHPLIASALLISTPAFLVSATNVMLEAPSLAFYLAAVAAFVAAVEDSRRWQLVLSACCMGAAVLSNYVGLTVIPLLAAWLVWRRRRATWELLAFTVPLAMIGLWCWHGLHFHGSNPLLSAAGFLGESGRKVPWVSSPLAALTFTGGCILTPVFVLPALMRRWWAAAASAIVACAVVAALALRGSRLTLFPTAVPWHQLVLAGVFSLATCAALFSVFGRDRRDAMGALLGLWFVGIFAFTVFVSWTVAARFVLFAAPAVILISLRAVESAVSSRVSVRWLAGALAAQLVVSLLLAVADYQTAGVYRDLADRIHRNPPQGRIFFAAHWGLQYYMEAHGAEIIDEKGGEFRSGDLIVQPAICANEPLPAALKSRVAQLGEQRMETRLPLHLTHPAAHAGFYSHTFGLLPYGFGPGWRDVITLYRVQ